jgi:hypothetical protein
MHREQVIDALWPGLSSDTAAPRLHKAAHYARRALDDADAVVLRQELVGLYPGRDDVEVDVHEFTRTAQQALRTGDATLAAEALEWYAGPLLPEDPYSTWTDEHRTAAGQQHLIAQALGRWDDVPVGEPADEDAHPAPARGGAAAATSAVMVHPTAEGVARRAPVPLGPRPLAGSEPAASAAAAGVLRPADPQALRLLVSRASRRG